MTKATKWSRSQKSKLGFKSVQCCVLRVEKENQVISQNKMKDSINCITQRGQSVAGQIMPPIDFLWSRGQSPLHQRKAIGLEDKAHPEPPGLLILEDLQTLHIPTNKKLDG